MRAVAQWAKQLQADQADLSKEWESGGLMLMVQRCSRSNFFAERF